VKNYGKLIPKGGGDVIPLLRQNLLVGRRESCDIRLRFANVSAHHCELTLRGGYWYVRDLGSSNGTKVNGSRVQEKLVAPGDSITFAKHEFEMSYSPVDNGAIGPPPAEKSGNEIFGQSLLDRAGLSQRAAERTPIHEADMPERTYRIRPTDDQ